MELPDLNIVKRKLEHNRTVLIRQHKEQKFDITEFEWADINHAEVDLTKALSKQADIIAAIHVDVLPFYNERHGADGVTIRNDIVVLVELKSTWISPETIWQTESGTLYTGVPGKNSKTAVESSAVGSWSKLSANSVLRKNLLTFLVWLQSKPGSKFFLPIAAWSLPGEYVFEKLSKAVEKGHTSSQIKSSEFRINGISIPCVIPAKGLELWKEEMRLIAPVYPTDRAKKKQPRQSTSSLKTSSRKKTKTDSRMQMSNPYNLTNVQREILDSVEIESTCLCD